MSTRSRQRAVRISIDLGAIEHNLAIAKKRSGGQKLFAVVKADAYGHGAVRVANALRHADGFAVVSMQEALALRDASITKPILVLQGAHIEQECTEFVQHNLWPVIHCEEQLIWFAALPNAHKVKAWLKVDTGMGRLGFSTDRAKHILASSSSINWFGVMTHFASADDIENGSQTQAQIARFSSVTNHLSVQKSLASSAAVLAWPESQADWARPGIMLYGVNPVHTSNATRAIAPAEEAEALRLAMRVTAPVIAVKHYRAGDNIGYAASFTCPEPMQIAYAAIGYGDGLPRVLNSGATVCLNGAQCPIVGRVSMDTIAVDTSPAAQVHVGDEVVLWGVEHSIEILADAANTISYELMTSIRGNRDYI